MIGEYQQRCAARVDAALAELFEAPREELTRLYQAMRYSVVTVASVCARCWSTPPAKRWMAISTAPMAPPARWS